MRIIQSELRPIDVVAETLCDSCGLTCCRADNHKQGAECPEHPWHSFETANIIVHWGYYSNKDTETHEIVLCEACYDKMLELMNIKPSITHYL
jgi:hypothetical protein